MEYLTKSDSETKQLGRQLASRLKGGEAVCLYGDMGAGKTVFVQGMINYFLPGKRVLSPTFIIVRHYRIPNMVINNFLHIDLYRMTNKLEISELEFYEHMNNPNSIVAIEWAEKLGNLLPENRIEIRIKSLDDDKRLITIETRNGKT